MTTRRITVESQNKTAVRKQRVGLMEPKGVGRPDSICDAIMEQISLALRGEYTETFGRIVPTT